MKVTVLLFAGAREKVGTGRLIQDLPSGATVQTLMDRLVHTWPALAEMRLRTAVNAAYALPQTVLLDGDEVACIPPVGGG